MKATVIKFYDEQGNEIKNVSTEILVNDEIYVKKEADKQPDYSHLVGMWCRFIGSDSDFVNNQWYECIVSTLKDFAFKDKHGRPNGFCNFPEDNTKMFDLTNPKPYNPDTVVGLKELPNDGKVYAECLEDVELLGEIKMIKGLFYETRNGEIFNHENDNNPSCGFTINGAEKDFTKHFRIHTPAKPIWETCREDMWEYHTNTTIRTIGLRGELLKQDVSIFKNLKHYNASSYLSEVARRCNGDRVVDWTGIGQTKFHVRRYQNTIEKDLAYNDFKRIAFLDKAARDHSFEVDNHIWNDYYGLPNE